MHAIPLSKDELIGKQVSITDCRDPGFQHVTGIIIDETKHMFVIKTAQGMKHIAKDIATFQFEYQGIITQVRGSTLCYRPEDRIKKTR